MDIVRLVNSRMMLVIEASTLIVRCLLIATMLKESVVHLITATALTENNILSACHCYTFRVPHAADGQPELLGGGLPPLLMPRGRGCGLLGNDATTIGQYPLHRPLMFFLFFHIRLLYIILFIVESACLIGSKG